MQAILVATDFSSTGDNAAHYGAVLAQSWACELILLHSYFLPVTFNDPAMPIIPMDEIRTANENRMGRSVASLQQAFPDLSITSRIEYGDIADMLEDVIGELKPRLLIIGSHAENDDAFWTGDTTTALLRESKTPILAVPGDYQYQPIRNICLAVDSKGIPENMELDALHLMLKTTKAGLHILHIVKDALAEGPGQPTMPLPAFDASIPMRFHLTNTSGSVDDAIAEFIHANEVDWLVILPHHYSFWDSLFHKSHTKAMVHKGGVPILALH